MELLESQDPEKIKLIETSDRHKRELEKEMKSMTDKTEKVVKNALIIGSVLAATYLIVNQLSSSGKKKKNTKPMASMVSPGENLKEEEHAQSVFTQIVSKAADTATLVLLDLAKDALAEFLKNRKQQNGDS